MDIIIIQGENIQKIHDRLIQFKKEARKRGWELIYLQPDNNISEILASQSLFPKESLYIIDDFKKIRKKELKWIGSNIKKLHGTLIVYQHGNILKSLYKGVFEPKKIEQYDIPKSIFIFLESFYPGNNETLIKTLHETCKNEAVEFVFVMLARHLKDLYWVIKEPSKIPYSSWRISKLESQAGKFKQGQIIDLFKRLAVIDVKVKTSKASLITELDLMILTQLE